MLVRMVTRSVSEVSSCDESLAYTSGFQKHGPTPKGGAVQLAQLPQQRHKMWLQRIYLACFCYRFSESPAFEI
ncbi:hypothetical protein Fuma_05451 [Fuerstiella marisgermanici]|uniref:Uncharacterized protein n=1 Tax=Fuerstiella marisgermanici TaxID=1891926 RepID=A0A1P8WP14_9PLAN|nr:hypothetical protein Fuma_05451 [Fuerstiella marisgermanici]